MLRHSCWCFGTPAGVTTLLLREQACPDWCSSTPAGVTTLLLREQARPVGAPALLLVLRHSCYVGRHVLYGATAPQYCIVPSGTYCTASYSSLIIGLGSQIDIC